MIAALEMVAVYVATAGLFLTLALAFTEMLLTGDGNGRRMRHTLLEQVLCILMVKWRVNVCGGSGGSTSVGPVSVGK